MAVTKKIRDKLTGKIHTFKFDKEPTDDDIKQAMSSISEKEDKKLEPLFKKPVSGTKIDPNLQVTAGLLGQLGAGAAQGLTGGAAEALLRKGGKTFNKPQTVAERIARTGSMLAGATAGPGAIVRASKAIPSLTARMFLAGAAITPETPTGDLLQVKDRIIQGTLSATFGTPLLKVSGSVLRLTKNIPKVVTRKGGVAFSEKMRDEFNKVLGAARGKYKAALDKMSALRPNARVDASKAFQKAQDVMNDAPSVKIALNRIPQAKVLLENPQAAKGLTIQEAQNLRNQITAKISPRVLSGEKATINDIPLLDFIDDFSDDMAQAFPEIKEARTAFAQIKQPHDQLKPFFRFNKVIDSIGKDFKGPEAEQALRQILPPEVIKEMGGVKSAMTFVKIAKKIGIGAAVASGLTLGGALTVQFLKPFFRQTSRGMR